MTKVQKQIAELTSQIVQAAKAGKDYAVYTLGNTINDLRDIEQLELKLIQAAKNGNTITAYNLCSKINKLKDRVMVAA
tara:strand:- start:328 stop:561 length:234 start_codon:yes stop_codon:yes gene_type:complete